MDDDSNLLAELDSIISKLQGTMFVEKQNVGVFKDMRYWNYEDIVVKLKPLIEKYGIRFVWTDSEIIFIPCEQETTIRSSETGGKYKEKTTTVNDPEKPLRTRVMVDVDKTPSLSGGTNIVKKGGVMFLKMGLCVRYKGVQSNIQYGVTEITSEVSKDSSQKMGAHESYLKKRILGNFLMIATDEAKMDTDNPKNEIKK